MKTEKTVLKIAKTQDDVVITPPVEIVGDTITPATATNTFISHNWWIDTVTNESWAYQHDSFSEDEIKQIIKIGTNADATQTSSNSAKFVDGTTQVSWIRSDLESNKWIFQRLVGYVKSMNDQFFNYDISYIENLRFVKLEVDDEGVVQKHTDTLYSSTGTRKLSFTVMLQSSTDGGELLLHLGNQPTVLPNISGAMYLYPSYALREVTKVNAGALYILSGTVVGPRFK